MSVSAGNMKWIWGLYGVFVLAAMAWAHGYSHGLWRESWALVFYAAGFGCWLELARRGGRWRWWSIGYDLVWLAGIFVALQYGWLGDPLRGGRDAALFMMLTQLAAAAADHAVFRPPGPAETMANAPATKSLLPALMAAGRSALWCTVFWLGLQVTGELIRIKRYGCGNARWWEQEVVFGSAMIPLAVFFLVLLLESRGRPMGPKAAAGCLASIAVVALGVQLGWSSRWPGLDELGFVFLSTTMWTLPLLLHALVRCTGWPRAGMERAAPGCSVAV